MKKAAYILAGASLFLLLLYTLAHWSAPKASEAVLAFSAQEQPPAPYPADFKQRAASLPGLEIKWETTECIPQNLKLTDGGEFPLIGSRHAVKGGTLRLCNVGPFPANFLAFGSPSPQFFHYNLFRKIEIPLVRKHPATGQCIPGLAEAWGEQDGILWFKLNPAARYSNGRPVRAADFALGALLRHEQGENALSEYASELLICGEHVLGIRPRHKGIFPHLTAAEHLHPAEPGFYSEYGSDYRERYAQRIPPTTGAYSIGKIQRGRLIILNRNANWWAKDMKGFSRTHNPDCIQHHFLTDEAQAWEMFLRGKLDLMQTRNIVAWQENLKSADARIHRHRFKLTCPMPPYGIALNAANLPDINLRRGLLQAMDMQHAMQMIFRGDVERLPQFATGYRHLSHTTAQYHYNPAAARDCFRAAGYTRSGQDGILMREDGTRLSIRLAYTPSAKISMLISLLAQSAQACGAEIVPEPLPWQNCAALVKAKRHEMLFWATVAGAPLPAYKKSFHSEAMGDDAPFCLQSAEMDKAIKAVEQASTLEAAAHCCQKADALIHELAIWLPGWMENRVNVAVWQHLHLPDSGYDTYDIVDSHTLWIK